MPYHKLLEQHIRHGSLTLHFPDGRAQRFGHDDAPHAELILRHPGALQRIMLDPEFMFGETYVDGDWDAPAGGLLTLFEVLMRNFPERVAKPPLWERLLRGLIRRGNTILHSYRNVAHHYDLDEWLFRRFLDQDMQYSCAYFYAPDINLEEAQRAKRQHILHKLLLQPGQRVLDIGCGWGGLALHLAEHAGVHVTGLTLSREQLRVAEARARERGLSHAVEFRLQDYREHDGVYDRIVSVGMFEHVGRAHYPEYFARIHRLLHTDGSALLHTIGRYGPPGATNPWIEKYIFPGGYNPALSEVSAVIERSGLVNCDTEVWRLHYAMTLAAWQQRFQASRAEIAARMSERFVRMWEFYLAACEATFRWRDLVVFQIQLAKRLDAVPVTRDYLYRGADETSHRVRVA
ncbi:MAG: cyclopropane-fatty-acyl-phospholipid synthase family protein [Pseudomonadota bacterium]